MGKFYSANEEFTDFLEKLKFVYHNREEVLVKYFTEPKTGKQVKVNYEDNVISLLDNQGLLIDEGTSFTDNQIKNFLNN